MRAGTSRDPAFHQRVVRNLCDYFNSLTVGKVAAMRGEGTAPQVHRLSQSRSAYSHQAFGLQRRKGGIQPPTRE